MEGKQALRRTGVTARLSAVPDLRLLDHLEPLIAQATRIASYVPMATEPGLTPRPGWLLPVLLADRDLDWAVFDGTLTPSLLTSTRLQEPTGPRLGVDALASCDLVLVPALLVDRRGNRLGKGGGSYDRALARATGLTVALLHDGELVEQLPTEPHDVPVRAAATPSEGVVHLTGSWST
jgi:5-formyltetrahydrofolate cyclo-ligase